MEYTIGVEEEYFLSCQESRKAPSVMPTRFAQACRQALPTVFAHEMLQSQVEVATPPCREIGEIRKALNGYRSTLSDIAREHDLDILAAGTHPTAIWSRQRTTESARYGQLMDDLQMLGNRNMVCGLHVHVAVPSPERRVDLMVRMIPFVPLLLVLSTSSPFWQSRRTGLMSYRLTAYDELPRTGMPELFETAADYQRYVETMVAARAIEDSSYLWWAIRPSRLYPTLELRAADCCTSIADAVSIAALFRCLVRRLDRDPKLNAGMTGASRALACENKWRAQRYGIQGSFIDECRRQAISVGDHLEDVLALVADDAAALDCSAEICLTRDILSRGTSACRQLAIYTDERQSGAAKNAALASVVDWLVAATVGSPSFSFGRSGLVGFEHAEVQTS
jgi:carboxylate-amine ligase